MNEPISTLIGAAAGPARLVPLLQERSWEWSWHPMWGLWGIGGVVMLLGMLLFWILVLVTVLAGLRWLIGQGKASRADTALDILRQRYARGEIDRQEFETKKRDLAGS
jgi:putative membrane protein